MSIKSDKTFEEIVERLVALFRPQQDDAAEPAQPHTSSSEPAVQGSSPPTTPLPDEEPAN
jgi:hypothetical protein